MIPQSAAAGQVEQDPAVAGVKQCLEQLEQIRIQKEKVMNDGVAMFDNLQLVEELMKIHQNQAQKEEVFGVYRNKFTEHYNQNEMLEQQK